MRPMRGSDETILYLTDGAGRVWVPFDRLPGAEFDGHVGRRASLMYTLRIYASYGLAEVTSSMKYGTLIRFSGLTPDRAEWHLGEVFEEATAAANAVAALRAQWRSDD